VHPEATRPITVYQAGHFHIVGRMRSVVFLSLLLGTALGVRASVGDRVSIPPMKTSIYVGSVTLTPGDFLRAGAEFTATYEAKVWPWFFWSERGRITVVLPEADFARLLAGGTVEFTGEALNHKGKPRKVSGRAQPSGNGSHSGKIKVRIGVDDIELIFNGTYRLGAAAG
jgi:hypothetical protein